MRFVVKSIPENWEKEDDEIAWMKYWEKQSKLYPELDLIALYFKKVIYAEDDDGEEGITAEIRDKKVKKT